MSKQYIRLEHLSLVRAFALAGAMAALPACGAEVQGCDAQGAALEACTAGEEPTSDAGTEAPPSDRCLPDSVIPDDIAATICASVPATPVPHDCPGGAPSDDCVASPGGGGQRVLLRPLTRSAAPAPVEQSLLNALQPAPRCLPSTSPSDPPPPRPSSPSGRATPRSEG